MSTTPPAVGNPVAGDAPSSSADEIATAAAAAAPAARPRAAATVDVPVSAALPLASSPPNPLQQQLQLSVPLLAPPPTSLPASISGIVDFKLALDGANFVRWRNYLNLILARFHAEDHVQDGAAVRLSDPAWRDDDNTIVLWFLATIAGDLLDIVAPAGSTAHTIWKRLHEYFLANEAELAMHLGQEFRAAVRGDLTINEYCRKLQGIAAALADVREPVSDRTLTLQMLDGLGKKFELQAAIIQATVPLPTFAQARSRLVLAELALDKRARTEGAQVLAVHSADDRGGDRSGGRGGDRGDRGGRGGGDRGGHQAGGGRGGYPHGGNRTGGRGGRGQGRGRGRGDVPGGGVRGSQQPWLGYFAPVWMPFPPPRAPWIPPQLGRYPRLSPRRTYSRVPGDAPARPTRPLRLAILLGRLGDVPLCPQLRIRLPSTSRVDHGHRRLITCHRDPGPSNQGGSSEVQ